LLIQVADLEALKSEHRIIHLITSSETYVESQAYLDEVRDYMPSKHAIFIRALRSGPSIMHFGESSFISANVKIHMWL